MKLKQLKVLIDTAVEAAGDLDPNVEVWHNGKQYYIEDVSQFSIIPDVTLSIQPDTKVSESQSFDEI